MKLSDFGLCKPLNCLSLSAINENEMMDDKSLSGSANDGCSPVNGQGSSWKNPTRATTTLTNEQVDTGIFNCGHSYCSRSTVEERLWRGMRLIVHWKIHVKFPEESRLSPATKDLICRLLCDVDHQLGTGVADQIKVLWAKCARRCNLESSEAKIGLNITCLMQNEWMKVKTKEAMSFWALSQSSHSRKPLLSLNPAIRAKSPLHASPSFLLNPAHLRKEPTPRKKTLAPPWRLSPPQTLIFSFKKGWNPSP